MDNASESKTSANTSDESNGVEGEDVSQGGLEDYPLRELHIRDEKRSAVDINRRIEKGLFILDPDFQRDFVWDEKKQSKLIESIIMRIPLPVFYVAEDINGKLIVVDGLQRLTTLSRFFKNELKLQLEKREELNNKKFIELPIDLQNRIEDCQLTFFIIDSKAPLRAKLDIFERVNGGEYLTRQQMRNALYNGQATAFLRDVAKSEQFIKVTGRSLNQKTMQDREFVNRFCSFAILPIMENNELKYAEMDDWLAKGLSKMNKFEATEMTDLKNHFERSMENNVHVFEKHAFRKFTQLAENRTVINASLFDCMSTGLAFYNLNKVVEKKAGIISAFSNLLNDVEFKDAISGSTNSTKSVRKRYEKSRKLLKDVLGDPLPSPFQFQDI
ncbi:MAG: DUF262 domain-containing protein [Candidatus Symbiobacter sp.]|nr:DUF262 domain-containing protein [Candidatus Symbiobacter sp.]